jgi:hypothetical protein
MEVELEPQLEPEAEDTAYWCVGRCGAATDMNPKCGDTKCDLHCHTTWTTKSNQRLYCSELWPR